MRGTVGRIFRYSLVGLVTTGLYFSITMMLSDVMDYSLLTSSIFAYTIAIIFQYISHSLFTFRVNIYDRGHISKFLVAVFAGYVVSSLLIKMGQALGVENIIIVSLIVIIIPAMNYVVMSFLVFVGADDGRRQGGHGV